MDLKYENSGCGVVHCNYIFNRNPRISVESRGNLLIKKTQVRKLFFFNNSNQKPQKASPNSDKPKTVAKMQVSDINAKVESEIEKLQNLRYLYLDATIQETDKHLTCTQNLSRKRTSSSSDESLESSQTRPAVLSLKESEISYNLSKEQCPSLGLNHRQLTTRSLSKNQPQIHIKESCMLSTNSSEPTDEICITKETPKLSGDERDLTFTNNRCENVGFSPASQKSTFHNTNMVKSSNSSINEEANLSTINKTSLKEQHKLEEKIKLDMRIRAGSDWMEDKQGYFNVRNDTNTPDTMCSPSFSPKPSFRCTAYQSQQPCCSRQVTDLSTELCWILKEFQSCNRKDFKNTVELNIPSPRPKKRVKKTIKAKHQTHEQKSQSQYSAKYANFPVQKASNKARLARSNPKGKSGTTGNVTEKKASPSDEQKNLVSTNSSKAKPKKMVKNALSKNTSGLDTHPTYTKLSAKQETIRIPTKQENFVQQPQLTKTKSISDLNQNKHQNKVTGKRNKQRRASTYSAQHIGEEYDIKALQKNVPGSKADNQKSAGKHLKMSESKSKMKATPHDDEEYDNQGPQNNVSESTSDNQTYKAYNIGNEVKHLVQEHPNTSESRPKVYTTQQDDREHDIQGPQSTVTEHKTDYQTNKGYGNTNEVKHLVREHPNTSESRREMYTSQQDSREHDIQGPQSTAPEPRTEYQNNKSYDNANEVKHLEQEHPNTSESRPEMYTTQQDGRGKDLLGLHSTVPEPRTEYQTNKSYDNANEVKHLVQEHPETSESRREMYTTQQDGRGKDLLGLHSTVPEPRTEYQTNKSYDNANEVKHLVQEHPNTSESRREMYTTQQHGEECYVKDLRYKVPTSVSDYQTNKMNELCICLPDGNDVNQKDNHKNRVYNTDNTYKDFVQELSQTSQPRPRMYGGQQDVEECGVRDLHNNAPISVSDYQTYDVNESRVCLPDRNDVVQRERLPMSCISLTSRYANTTPKMPVIYGESSPVQLCSHQIQNRAQRYPRNEPCAECFQASSENERDEEYKKLVQERLYQRYMQQKDVDRKLSRETVLKIHRVRIPIADESDYEPRDWRTKQHCDQSSNSYNPSNIQQFSIRHTLIQINPEEETNQDTQHFLYRNDDSRDERPENDQQMAWWLLNTETTPNSPKYQQMSNSNSNATFNTQRSNQRFDRTWNRTYECPSSTHTQASSTGKRLVTFDPQDLKDSCFEPSFKHYPEAKCRYYPKRAIDRVEGCQTVGSNVLTRNSFNQQKIDKHECCYENNQNNLEINPECVQQPMQRSCDLKDSSFEPSFKHYPEAKCRYYPKRAIDRVEGCQTVGSNVLTRNSFNQQKIDKHECYYENNQNNLEINPECVQQPMQRSCDQLDQSKRMYPARKRSVTFQDECDQSKTINTAMCSCNNNDWERANEPNVVGKADYAPAGNDYNDDENTFNSPCLSSSAAEITCNDSFDDDYATCHESQTDQGGNSETQPVSDCLCIYDELVGLAKYFAPKLG